MDRLGEGSLCPGWSRSLESTASATAHRLMNPELTGPVSGHDFSRAEKPANVIPALAAAAILLAHNRSLVAIHQTPA